MLNIFAPSGVDPPAGGLLMPLKRASGPGRGRRFFMPAFGGCGRSCCAGVFWMADWGGASRLSPCAKCLGSIGCCATGWRAGSRFFLRIGRSLPNPPIEQRRKIVRGEIDLSAVSKMSSERLGRPVPGSCFLRPERGRQASYKAILAASQCQRSERYHSILNCMSP